MATGSVTFSNLAPMSVPFDGASKISAISPENPQTQTPQEQYFSTGNVTKDDQNRLVQTVSDYRNQWATDRLERFRIWMKNVLMYKGTQVLEWDYNNNVWFDALSWYRQNRQEDGEVVSLERWINNITLMLGTAWVGNMARGVPQTVVRPEDANVLADVTTARAASEAVSIIERRNLIRQMVRGEFEHLYLFGCYFKYTRGVLDGNWSGYDEEPVFGMQATTVPARKQCYSCGAATPISDLDADQDVHECPSCGAGMGPETYYPEENRQTLSIVGMRRVPRAMVKQTIHSPLEVDADPNARTIEKTPILTLSQEIDIGEARMMLPAMRNQIMEGAPDATSQNGEYERLRRSEVISITSGYPADTTQQRPTYTQTWMQPIAYYRLGDFEFGDRMLKAFPNGLRITMLGTEVVDIRAAVLTKQWSHCRLHEGFGLYCPSIAERVVTFNERFNATMQILDDWAQRAATGINVADESRLDSEKMSGRPIPPATIIGIPMKTGNESRGINEAFAHYDLPINPALWSYPQMLLTFCELIAGMPPQTFGQGTQEGVDTFGGQKQMLAQANTAMAPFWENVKEEHAMAAQNAIECLKELMECGAVREIREVVDAMGSAYRNKYVNWRMMQGKVKVYPDEDQGLPQRPEDIRATYESILEQVSKNNPVAKALFDVPVNQEVMLSTVAPSLKVPIEAQRTRTLQHINMLLEKDEDWVVTQDGQIVKQLPVVPEKNVDNFPVAKETLREFRQENFELRVENPMGWQRLDAYYEMLEDLDTQVGADAAKRQSMVSQAGAPPKQGPPPEQVAALQEIQKVAAGLVDRLAELASVDPMLTKGTINGQVSAAKEVVDAALKATEAMVGT